MPHYVGYELHRNSIASLQQRVDGINRLENKQTIALSNFLEEVPPFYKTHPEAADQLDALTWSCEQLIKKAQSTIKVLQEKHVSEDGDVLLRRLEQLFSEVVGDPLPSDELRALPEEGEWRYKSGIPPGQYDQNKKKTGVLMYEGQQVPEKFGDLIIWKQILRKGEELGNRGIIFVTNDAKRDWRRPPTAKGQYGLPRSELRSEFRSRVGHDKFWLASSLQFFIQASRCVHIELSDQTLKSVERVSKSIHQKGASYYNHLRYRTEQEPRHAVTLNHLTTIQRWIRSRGHDAVSLDSSHVLRVTFIDRPPVRFHVFVVRHEEDVELNLNRISFHYAGMPSAFVDCIIVWLFPTKKDLRVLSVRNMASIDRCKIELGSLIGYIEGNADGPIFVSEAETLKIDDDRTLHFRGVG